MKKNGDCVTRGVRRALGHGKRPTIAGLTLLFAGATLAASEPELSRQLEPLKVTPGSLLSRTENELVQPVTVLAGDELERRRAGTLGEMLETQPGISNADFGPGVGRPVIRGLQGSRVQVLDDGLRTSDVSGEGVDHAVASDPLRASAVEVIRGPATLLYGSGAAGGVVNMVSERFSPAIGDRVAGTLYGSYGENGKDRQGRAAVDVPVGEHVALRADYTIRRSDDFRIKGFQESDGGGIRDRLVNSSVDSDAWSVTGMWSGEAGYMGLGFSRWETEYGIPEAFDPRPRDMGGQSDEYERIFADYKRVDLRAEKYAPFAGIESLRLNLAYTEFRQDEKEFEYERTPQGGVLDEIETEAVFRQDEFDGRLELIHAPLAGLNGVVGLDVNRQNFQADDPREGRDFFIRPTRGNSLAIFALEELPTSFGQLEFGARLGQERYRPQAIHDSSLNGIMRDGQWVPFPEDPGSRRFTLLSGSVGLRHDLAADRHLRATLTRSERAPSPEQLYAFGRHGAAGTFEVGDPNLSKETYLNAELRYEQRSGPTRLDVAAFVNRVDDFIFFQFVPDENGDPLRVDRHGEPDPDGELLVFNDQKDVWLYGMEFMLAHDVETGLLPLTLRFSGDWLRGRLRDGGNLPRMTPPRLGVGLDARWQGLEASLDYRRVFAQNHTATAESRTAGYNELGFDLLWKPMAGQDLSLFLRGRNLLNEAGRHHQSFFKENAPIIGRAFSAGLRYDF